MVTDQWKEGYREGYQDGLRDAAKIKIVKE